MSLKKIASYSGTSILDVASLDQTAKTLVDHIDFIAMEILTLSNPSFNEKQKCKFYLQTQVGDTTYTSYFVITNSKMEPYLNFRTKFEAILKIWNSLSKENGLRCFGILETSDDLSFFSSSDNRISTGSASSPEDKELLFKYHLGYSNLIPPVDTTTLFINEAD